MFLSDEKKSYDAYWCSLCIGNDKLWHHWYGGTIFTGYTEPAMVTSNSLGRKCGTAKTVNVLGIVAVGDAGVQQAAMMGGITKISHVDKKVVSVLGLFTVNKYYVYGE